MSNYIFKNGIEILRCSNWAMEVLYEALLTTLNTQGLQNNKVLMNFVQRLNQNIYGRGCIYIDVVDFFNDDSTKASYDLLLDIIKKAINKIKEANTFDSQFILLLEQFYDALA